MIHISAVSLTWYFNYSTSSADEERKVDQAIENVTAWLPRFSGLVLGSGLGRDKAVQICAKRIIEFAKRQHIPLVIDGVTFTHTHTPYIMQFAFDPA